MMGLMMKKMMGDDEDKGPSLMLEEKMLPEIADWKVGETYTLSIKVRMTDLHECDCEEEECGVCAHFEMLGASPARGKKVAPEELGQAVKSKVETEYEEE